MLSFKRTVAQFFRRNSVSRPKNPARCGGPGSLDSHRSGISAGGCRKDGFDFPGFESLEPARCGTCGQPPTRRQAVGNAKRFSCRDGEDAGFNDLLRDAVSLRCVSRRGHVTPRRVKRRNSPYPSHDPSKRPGVRPGFSPALLQPQPLSPRQALADFFSTNSI